MVEICFEWRRYCEACSAAKTSGADVEMSSVLAGALGYWLGSDWKDVVQCEHSAGVVGGVAKNLVALTTSFMLFVEYGCPIVTIDDELAHALAETDPPTDLSHSELAYMSGLSPALVLGVGDSGCLLYRAAPTTSDASSWIGGTATEWLREVAFKHGGLHGGFASLGEWWFDEEQTTRLMTNVLLVLHTRPEGITVEERVPSAKAARKRGENPARLPKVEYVFGTTVPLSHPSQTGSSDRTGITGGRHRYRYRRRGHFRSQVYGKGRLLRKHLWIQGTWCGPADAPLKIHATKIGPSDVK